MSLLVVVGLLYSLFVELVTLRLLAIKRKCLCREVVSEIRFKTKTSVCGENLFLKPDLGSV